MIYIICIILLLVYIALPLPAQLVFFIVNIFTSDPIPFLDEAIMIISMAKKINTIENVVDTVGHIGKAVIKIVFAFIIFAIIYSFF